MFWRGLCPYAIGYSDFDTYTEYASCPAVVARQHPSVKTGGGDWIESPPRMHGRHWMRGGRVSGSPSWQVCFTSELLVKAFDGIDFLIGRLHVSRQCARWRGTGWYQSSHAVFVKRAAAQKLPASPCSRESTYTHSFLTPTRAGSLRRRQASTNAKQGVRLAQPR